MTVPAEVVSTDGDRVMVRCRDGCGGCPLSCRPGRCVVAVAVAEPGARFVPGDLVTVKRRQGRSTTLRAALLLCPVVAAAACYAALGAVADLARAAAALGVGALGFAVVCLAARRLGPDLLAVRFQSPGGTRYP